MSIDFSKVTALSDQYGNIVEVTDASGRVMWSAATLWEDRAVLDVAKQTLTTYAGETKYENEQFVLLNIYPQKGGTVRVTYGGLTKTITDTSGAATPNAQAVFFGTFNGVSDSVDTPDSGILTIEGNFATYGCGTYGSYSGKSSNAYCYCITGVSEFGEYIKSFPSYAFYVCTGFFPSALPSGLTSIGAYAFYGCEGLAISELPSGLTSIGSNAFEGCTGITLSTLPSGITSIADSTFRNCTGITEINIPDNVISIGHSAFNYTRVRKVVIGRGVTSIGKSAFYTYKGITIPKTVRVYATTPPTLAVASSGSNGEQQFEDEVRFSSLEIVVNAGCGDAYKQGWSYYASVIVEES